jgi:hypothetical protein
MLFVDETKLNVNMHSNDQVNLNLTLHVEASCMWFINEIKLKANMHS